MKELEMKNNNDWRYMQQHCSGGGWDLLIDGISLTRFYFCGTKFLDETKKGVIYR